MGRFTRNSAILAKIEVTEGTDSVPTGAANALLVSNQSINPLNAQNVDRDLVRNYFGGSEQLVGTAFLQVTFTVELAGSGTAGTAPAWGELLRACGFAESGAAGYKAYQPDTPSAAKSATIYYYDDGALYKLLGARGTFKLNMGIGQRPTFEFSFMGQDGGLAAVANPTTTLIPWKAPQVITNPNTRDVVMGGTYAAGAVTGGANVTSQGLTLDLGNQVEFNPLLGADYIDIVGRTVTGSVALDLDAAGEVAMMASVKGNTLQAVSLEHGVGAGKIVGVYMAAVQMLNPSKVDAKGRRLQGYDLRSVPLAGNDDLIIYAK